MPAPAPQSSFRAVVRERVRERERERERERDRERDRDRASLRDEDVEAGLRCLARVLEAPHLRGSGEIDGGMGGRRVDRGRRKAERVAAACSRYLSHDAGGAVLSRKLQGRKPASSGGL